MVSDAFSCNIQRGVNYNDLLRWQRAGFTQGGQGSVINNAQRDNINAVFSPAVKMAAEEVFKINLLNLFTIFYVAILLPGYFFRLWRAVAGQTAISRRHNTIDTYLLVKISITLMKPVAKSHVFFVPGCTHPSSARNRCFTITDSCIFSLAVTIITCWYSPFILSKTLFFRRIRRA